MRGRRTHWLLVLAVGGGVGLGIWLALPGGFRRPAEPVAPPEPIPPVHDFTLRNLAGEFPGEIRTAEFSGKVQLILFFRTDDPACRGSLPMWNSLQNEFAARGFTLVGAVVDDRPFAQLAAEAIKLPMGFPVGLADGPVVAAFGGTNAIRAIPTAFLLDRAGAIARRYAGHEPPAVYREDIAALLDDRPLPPRRSTGIAPEENLP